MNMSVLINSVLQIFMNVDTSGGNRYKTHTNYTLT
jgi:hypothetical protein